MFDRLFSSGGIEFVSDARTYVDALERCALSKSRERVVVGKWVDELWTRWEELEHGWVNGETKATVTARLVERAHTAARRVHLLLVFLRLKCYGHSHPPFQNWKC
jgi:hypothetical protein